MERMAMRQTGQRRMDMQVGDLVRVLVDGLRTDGGDFPLGVIVGFDEDEDPIVFEDRGGGGEKLPHYRSHLEVIE